MRGLVEWLTPEWIAAISGSIAAVASVVGAWFVIRGAVHQARSERSARLKLGCSRYSANAVCLSLIYRTTEASEGVEAEITVFSPAGAVTVPYGHGAKSDGMGNFPHPEITPTDGATNTRRTRLTAGHLGASGSLTGRTIIAMPAGTFPETSRVRVRLHSTASRKRLISRTSRISPTS